MLRLKGSVALKKGSLGVSVTGAGYYNRQLFHHVCSGVVRHMYPAYS
jgi:hypothetical protein